jgi:hypothetical protein
VCQCDSQCCRQGKMQYVIRMVRFLSSMLRRPECGMQDEPHRGCHLHQSARGPVSARAWPAAGAATAQSSGGSHRPARGRPSAPSPVLLQPRIAEDRTAACELHCGLPGNHSIVSPAMRPDSLRIGSRGPGISPIRPEAGIGVPAGGGGPGTRGLSPHTPRREVRREPPSRARARALTEWAAQTWAQTRKSPIPVPGLPGQ